MLNFVASVKLVYYPLIQKEYDGKYKMVMQGSQQGTVVTKVEFVKIKVDIQVEAYDCILTMLIFCYCTPTLCLSCTSAKGTCALLKKVKGKVHPENLAPTGIRSPDRPARSQSLFRLHYPAHRVLLGAKKIVNGCENH